MAATTNKGLEAQTTGSNSGTWGDVLNNQVIGYLDTMLGGMVAISLSSSTVLISQANARNCMLSMTGTLLSNVAVNRDAGVLMIGFYYWENLTTGNFSVTFGYGAGTTTSVVLPQGRRGVLWMDTTSGVRIVAIAGSSGADPIPAATPMLFYSSAAPTGWTLSGLNNNYALRIVSSGGGTTGGSVGFATLFGRTATDAHTLTLAQIPAHTHTTNAGATLGINTDNQSSCPIFAAGTASGSAGGGDGHTHNIDMRVLYADFVICTKN